MITPFIPPLRIPVALTDATHTTIRFSDQGQSYDDLYLYRREKFLREFETAQFSSYYKYREMPGKPELIQMLCIIGANTDTQNEVMTHYQNLLSVSHGDLNVSYGPDNSIIFESKNTEWNWYFEIDSEGYWVYFRKKIRLGDYIVWEKNSSINFDDVLSDIKQAK